MSAFQPMITGTQYVVSAGHYLATQAAMDILDAGGNAIDAGVAANLALGVVQSEMVQIAGVAPIMVYLVDSDQVLTLTGVGPWPKAASLDRFVQEFGEVPKLTIIPLTERHSIDPRNVFFPTPSKTAGTPLLLVIFITSLAKLFFV